MLNAKKLKKACLVVTILALVATMVMCLASCGSATATEVVYVDGTLQKTTCNVNEYVDITGAQIKVTYSDGSFKQIDVTSQMVSHDLFTKAGAQKVTITYTEGDVTLECTMPITIVDPAEDVAAQLAASVTADEMKDNVIASLINSYTAKINNAADKAAAEALASECKARINDYKAELAAAKEKAEAEAAAKLAAEKALADAKEAAKKQVEDKDLSDLYEKYRQMATVSKETALKNIAASTTPEAAKAFADNYINEVTNYKTIIEYQEGPSTADDPNLMDAKLGLIDEAKAVADELLSDPWYSDDQKLEASEKLQTTTYIILMSMDINSAKKALEDFTDVITNAEDLIDEIYKAYIAIGDVHYEDTCDDLIENAEVLIAQAMAIDPVEATNRLTAYATVDAEGESILVNLIDGPVEGLSSIEGITAKRARYNELGKAACMAVYGREQFDNPSSTVAGLDSVVNAIDLIDDPVTIDSLAGIKAAYTAYEDWAKYYHIIDETTAELDDTYGVYLYDGIDANDKNVLVANYNDIFTAWDAYVAIGDDLDEELDDFKALVDAIGDVMIGVTPVYEGETVTNADAVEYRDADKTILVDSKEAIEAARAAYEAICANVAYNVAAHADEYFIEDAVDYRTVLKDAEAKYEDLTARAATINRMIGRLLHNITYIDPVADAAAIDEIATLCAEFIAINKTGDTSYAGIIAEYSYFLKVEESFKKSKFDEVMKGDAIAAIEDYAASKKGDDPAVDAEIDDVVGEYTTQIEDVTYDSSKTLEEQKPDLDALVADAKAAIDACLPE